MFFRPRNAISPSSLGLNDALFAGWSIEQTSLHGMIGPTPLLSEIDKLRGRLEFLTASDGLGAAMSTLLRRLLQRVRLSAEAFPRLSLEDQQVLGPEILLSLMEIERSIETAEGTRQVKDNRIQALLQESIGRILGPGMEQELLVVMSPRDEWTLYCDLEHVDGRLAFVLFLSPTVDYTTDDLVVRVVHEAAHSEPHILTLTRPPFGEPRRLGEVLCDLVALLISGPAFVYSAVRLVQLRGAEKSRAFSDSHPSMACRANVLRNLAPKVWTSEALHQVTERAFEVIGELECLPEEAAEVQRLNREAVRSIPRYGPLATPESTWDQICASGDPNEQSSILLRLNA